MYNLWVWEQPSWRVLSTHEGRAEAVRVARNAGDPPGTWHVVEDGSPDDTRIRRNCRRRFPLRGGK